MALKDSASALSAELPTGRMLWITPALTEVARNVKITRSRLSHAIARLEESGWVCREDCSFDRRGEFVLLTDEGVAVLRRTAPGYVTAVRQALFERLTPEQQKTLGEIMEIVAEGLQPNEEGAELTQGAWARDARPRLRWTRCLSGRWPAPRPRPRCPRRRPPGRRR